MQVPSSAASTASRATELTTSSISAAGGHNDASSSNLSQQQSFTSEKHSLNKETFWDSDFEAERDAPDWRPKMNQEKLNRLKPKELKRQDVINGEGTFVIKCSTYYV